MTPVSIFLAGFVVGALIGAGVATAFFLYWAFKE